MHRTILLVVSCLCGVPAVESTTWRAPVWDDYLAKGPTGDCLPEFGSAGYHLGRVPLPLRPTSVSVTDFGAKPNDNQDDTASIQSAIKAVEEKGGGVIEFPAGQFDLNSMSPADPSKFGLLISKSGVVLRGAGSGKNGTCLHQHRANLAISGRSGLATAAIRFIGSEKLGPIVVVTSDTKRGDQEVTVKSSAGFTVGQIVRLTIRDPKLNPKNLHAVEADLASALVAPFALDDSLDVFLKNSTNGSIQFLLEVESIPTPTRIRFTEPLRTDLFVRWVPQLQTQTMLREVGIESLRMSCAWAGGFSHHKPFPHDAKGDYNKGGPGIIRTAQEQDYSWSAMGFERVAHSWVRDVTTVNYTQDVTVSYGKHMTIDGIRIEGQAGHCGVTLTRSSDCLVLNTEISAPRVHTFFVSGYSAGNVFTRARFLYGPFDPVSDCDTCLDFHGLAPFENLYDCIERAYVYPGGAYGYLPHAGQRNVFWNIQAPERMLRGGDSSEFFRTYAKTSSNTKKSAHEHWPKSFVIGVYRNGQPISINGRSDDRSDKWLTVQGLNRPGVEPASLYDAQRARQNLKTSK